MRISDWSSDVCSSDLSRQPLLSYAPVQRVAAGEKLLGAHRGEPRGCAAPVHRLGARARADAPAGDQQTDPEIGRAHVLTPVTNAHLVCRLLLEKKNNNKINKTTNDKRNDTNQRSGSEQVK